MLNEYHLQRIVILGQLLELNEEPVREMTIGHPPKRKEKTRETLLCPRNLSPVT